MFLPYQLYRELMTGKDGRLSFTKHLLVAVFVVFVAGHPLPAWLTLVLILSSKSVNLLYEWLIRLPYNPLSVLPSSLSSSGSRAATTTVQP